MINTDTFKWFIRGFVLTSLVLLAIVMVVRPAIGWAQGGSEEESNARSWVVDDTPPHAPGTDDPEGRAPITASSVVDSGEPRSNEAMVVGDAPPHAPGTDDPEGRAPVTASSVVDSGELHSNEAIVVGDAPPHAPGTDDPEGDTVGIEAASEITAQSYTSPLVVPAADFRNDGEAPEDYFFYFWGGYVRGEDPATEATCMMAPAYLPDGATVTSVYAYLYDNDSSNPAYAELQRVRNMTGVQETMASVVTSGTSTSIQYLGDTTINQPTVDTYYSYYVTTCLYSPSTRLWAVRIFYTAP